ncbi:hypothetical protein [Sulfurimonas sp.]
MSYVDHKTLYVATYKEIIIGFIVFSIILILLYPKDLLTKQVLAEQSNYDLSMLYLKSMLKSDPSNEKLMLTLANQAIKSNKKDLSFRLLKLLKNSKDEKIKSKAYILSYQIAKEDYFYLKSQHQTKAENQKYKELKNIFSVIMNEHFYTKNEIKQLYKEAYFLNDKRNTYYLLKRLLKKNPNDITLLSNAFYISYDLKEYEQSLSYLNSLVLLDTKHKNKWIKERYYLISSVYSYPKAEAYIIAHAQTSKYWSDKLIQFYLQHKRYTKASQVYMNQFYKTSNRNKQRKLWLQAINTLRAGNHIKKAVHLGYKYENYFFKDKQARVALLKLYISSNDLQKAKRLSKKILRKEK